jgi:hypothetical protein
LGEGVEGGGQGGWGVEDEDPKRVKGVEREGGLWWEVKKGGKVTKRVRVAY